MVNYKHAYNYWRKVVEEGSGGHFDRADFDDWFKGGAKPLTSAIDAMTTVETDNPGSREHFHQVVRRAFMDTLEACAKGTFGTGVA